MTGADFKAWLRRHGFSYAGAAAALGVQRRSVVRYASGERKVSDTVRRLCVVIDQLGWKRVRFAIDRGLTNETGD